MIKKNLLSSIELYYINKEKTQYETLRAISIESLKIVQSFRGWVSDEMIVEIAKVLNMSSSDLEEIATFYSQIYRCPVGNNVIRYCNSSVCYIMGCQNIQYTFEKYLNIKPGQTTFNNLFTLLPISCLGNCDKSPIIMINNDTYSNVTDHCIPILLEKYK